MDEYRRLGIALAIGLLIGLERGWQKRGAGEGRRVAGLRTFGLIGLLGGAAALLSRDSALFLAAAFAGLALVEAAAYGLRPADPGDRGITTVVASFVTFAVGALAASGLEAPAVASAVVMALLLGLKPELHVLLKKVQPEELKATLQLLLLSAAVLPVLPDRDYGPWEALNPYRLWWMVVLIAGISYVGHAAGRLAGGRRGTLVTALAAGLASSTAATLHFSRQAREAPTGADLHAAAVLAASALMFLRVLAVALAVAPALWASLAAPLAAAAAAGGPAAFWLARGGEDTVPGHETRNPLQLGMALRFGALLAFIAVATAGMRAWIGTAGLYLSAFVAGLADVDAITLTLAKLGSAETARGILLAAAVNTAVKGGLAAWLGGAALARRVWPGLAAALAAGAAALSLS